MAEKFLTNEAVLFPEVHELYLSGLDESDSNDEATSSKCSRWMLMSSLSSALSDHITFHTLPSYKLGIMLYRKGSDILTSLHYLLYQVRLKKKNSSESEGLLKLGLSLSEKALLFRAAMTLNNILISKADASKKPLIDDDVDISKISLANLISHTGSKLWNFIYLLTMNKTLRQDIEKECGVDWSSHICHSSESNTLKERTSKILMVISLCLFLCDGKASLMQMMLSNITASFSGSSELSKIFNQPGIIVSYESLHRYITKVVNLMNEDNMKMSFVPNGFVLTSIDNMDKGTPHASLSFDSSKYGLHGTSVQALQPKPHSIKNSPDDYVMFQRQCSINELEQMMLSNITASFSGSSELNKIFNQLGITVSYESLHRYITKVVNLMNEDNMKMSFVPNGFVLTIVITWIKDLRMLPYLLTAVSMGCMEHQYKPYNLNPIPLKTAPMTM